MKKLIYTLTLLLAFSFAQAQNDLKARIEFEEAEKAFEAEDFEKSLAHIKETEKLIGRWTSVTAYLKIEALYAITDMGRYNDPNMQALYEEVSQYMAYMNSLSSDDIPLEKYKTVYGIERALNVLKLHERQSPGFLKAKEVHDAADFDTAIPLWKELAQRGNSWAMRSLGLIYEQKKDNAEALTWYKKAVENGNAQAAIDLAFLDIEGGKNEKRKWLEQAGKMGHPDALDAQGWYAEYEDNNMQKAMEYYLQAMESGSSLGAMSIGDMYKDGKGAAKDFKKAEEYYLKAVKRNNGKAMYKIGILYHNGGNGIMKNHQTAMQWYLKAAEKNIEVAMIEIGWIYENGHGDFTKDYTKAEEWYVKAVKSGYELTYLYLGDLNSRNDNERQAFENYEKAAGAGYLRGILETAHFYYSGRGGVTKDYAKAANYYERYFNNKNRDKKNDTYVDNLINIYNRGGYGIERDREKVKYWRNFKR